LLDIAQKNARYRIGEAVRTRAGHQAELDVLRKFLGMKVLPRRIECVDVANWQGQANVASCVCFIDGKPAKHLYRQYNPESVAGQDDFAVVREVVRRRVTRGMEEGTLPDLLVIDGGRAQLDAALAGAAEAGVDANDSHAKHPLVIIGLAKSRVQDSGQLSTHAPKHSDERVFLVSRDDPKPLTVGSAEYRLLTRIRNEAHRFANLKHRRARSKEFFDSALTETIGIGEAIRRRLLESFGGMDGIRQATLEQLCAVKGLREDAATALHARLRQEEESTEDQ
jgi:excinuclease ABC subunit C